MARLHREASEELARRDPVVARLLERYGPMRIDPAPRAERRFASLANAIVSQQLHGRAAASIWERVQQTVGEPVTAEAVLAVPIPELRASGLSGSKVLSLLDLAEHVVDRRVTLDRIGRMADDEIIEHLTRVRGIGPWTAQMFLMFSLHRLDVWPMGDYGVRSGYARLHGMDDMPTARELEPLGARYRPYRSIIAWYCWAVADDRSF